MKLTVSPQGQRGPGYSLGYDRGKNESWDNCRTESIWWRQRYTSPDLAASGSVNLMVAGAPAEGPEMVISGNNSISVNVKEEFTSTEGQARCSFAPGDIHSLCMVRDSICTLAAEASMISEVAEAHGSSANRNER